MKIKVCGITGFQKMQQLQQLGIDYVGMIFYEGSKRYVGGKTGNEKLKIKNLEIQKVGVFVNGEMEAIEKAIDEYALKAVQLHGEETPEFCSRLMNKVEVVKAFRITGHENIQQLTAPYKNACQYFLFDTAPSIPQGSGIATI